MFLHRTCCNGMLCPDKPGILTGGLKMESSMANLYASAIAEEMGYVAGADKRSFLAGAMHALVGKNPHVENIHIVSYRTGFSEARKDAGTLDSASRREVFDRLDFMLGD